MERGLGGCWRMYMGHRRRLVDEKWLSDKMIRGSGVRIDYHQPQGTGSRVVEGEERG